MKIKHFIIGYIMGGIKGLTRENTFLALFRIQNKKDDFFLEDEIAQSFGAK